MARGSERRCNRTKIKPTHNNGYNPLLAKMLNQKLLPLTWLDSYSEKSPIFLRNGTIAKPLPAS